MILESLAASVVGLFAGATPAPSPAAADPQFVVSVAWLSQHLHDKNLVVLTVGPAGEYEKGHIPGALAVPGEGLENQRNRSRNTMDVNVLATESELHGTLEQLGVSDGSQVVLVLLGNQVPAVTRAQYLILYAGLERVAILDGGMSAWTAAGHPVSTNVPATPARGHITRHLIPALVVDAAYVQAHQAAPHSKIVDARAGANYGPSTASFSHIPGAVHVPFNSILDDSLHVLPLAAIEQRFRAAGVAPGDTVIGYCHVGIQATTMLLGARLLGHPVRLYPGSWQDWTARKLPTEGGKP